MATFSAQIRNSANRREHCSLDDGTAESIGRALGQQISVRKSEEQFALYTIGEVRRERPPTIVRMTEEGQERLGASGEFEAIVDSQVTDLIHDDCEAERLGEFVERLTDDGVHTTMVVIAPHGGLIEEYTDRQAERVAAELPGISCWRCKGWKPGGGAFDRWHITSTDIHEASFPLLNTIIHRGFTHAAAFHGFSEEDILIGGGACDSLKAELKEAIDDAVNNESSRCKVTIRIARAEDNFNGDSPENVVNRLAKWNGIQIEQALAVRERCWSEIADAVAAVYRRRLARESQKSL
jgi:phage replication-related protein YjqB (UPF0714/DUF867 family)